MCWCRTSWGGPPSASEDVPESGRFTVAPDWICEVLSPSTAGHDKVRKMPVYAHEGVQFQVFALGTDRRWVLVAAYDETARVRVEPFEEVAIEQATLLGEASRMRRCRARP